MNIFGIAIAVFSVLVLQVNGTPSCSYSDDQEKILVCSAGTTDYVLKKGLVSNHNKVVQIILESCKITEIKCDAFTELQQLKLLNIEDNKLQELKPCILKDLQELTSVNLANNRISLLPFDTFSYLYELQELNLGNNELKTLDPGVFDNMFKLRELDLSNNAIDGKNLTARIFVNNFQITTLNLSRNNMSATPENLLQSLHTLLTLNLDRCFLTNVPAFATKNNLKRMTQLVLSNNLISSLDDPTTFVNLESLEILNLGGNLIESIVESVFTPMRKLKGIILKHNQLKVIPDKLFQNMPKLVNIDLSYNNIVVINLSSFRNTPMKNLNLSGNKLAYLPENFYETLISSGGKLKKFLFTNNPWQCPCLREILQVVKRHNVEYNSTVFDGNTPVCVATDDYRNCKRG